jgi:hypothetical protein
LTEDVDVIVDADWVAAHEDFVLEEMRRLGFDHLPETCTFVLPEGTSLDLVGYSRLDQVDRIGGGRKVPVMVFAELSRLLWVPDSTVELRSGGRALSPAALTASKLLTVRLEKGRKDKLQALLLIEENAKNSEFLNNLRQHLATFSADRVEDAIADAQMASLAVSEDAVRGDSQSAGYTEMSQAIEQGLAVLRQLMSARKERD